MNRWHIGAQGRVSVVCFCFQYGLAGDTLIRLDISASCPKGASFYDFASFQNRRSRRHALVALHLSLQALTLAESHGFVRKD
jgi:hypothetical protein